MISLDIRPPLTDRPGYLSAHYSQSLAEFAAPLELPRAGGWLLTRSITGTEQRDAMGCYPLLCCQDWRGLSEDLANLPQNLVSISAVCDPLGAPGETELRAIFPDVCYRYKDHFFADLTQPLGAFVAPHHQRNARKAGQSIAVESIPSLTESLPEWNQLYEELIHRHHIRGIAAFSPASFARLAKVPGLLVLAAKFKGQTVGMILWMVHGKQAYYHLAAYSATGYELKASFPLFWQSFEVLATRDVERASLGSGAGVFAADEGLSRFKRGWSNEVRPAYFCGRILNRPVYNQLLTSAAQPNTQFFPAYRMPSNAAA